MLLLTDSWRTVYTLAALLAVVFCTWFSIFRCPRGDSGEDPARNATAEVRGRTGALVVPVALTILMGAGSSVYWTYGRSVAETQAGLSETVSLLFWGLIGAAGIGGSFSGDVASRFGTKACWAVSSAVLAASIAILPFATHITVACISGALFGAFYTVMCGLTIELARQAWPQAVGRGWYGPCENPPISAYPQEPSPPLPGPAHYR